MREQLAPNEELAAAMDEKLAVEKVEAMDEMYTQVDTDVTRGVRLVSVLDTLSAVLGSPRSGAAAAAGASVSQAVQFHWLEQEEAPAYKRSSGSRFELSQQEPNRLRLIPAGD
jgi:hypothetical protein